MPKISKNKSKPREPKNLNWDKMPIVLQKPVKMSKKAWHKADGKKTIGGIALTLAGAALIFLPKHVGLNIPFNDEVGIRMVDAGLIMTLGIGLPHKLIKWWKKLKK